MRVTWDAAIAKDKGVRVAEVAETGSASGERLMGLADDIQAKKLGTAEALVKAKAVISEVTGSRPAACLALHLQPLEPGNLARTARA